MQLRQYRLLVTARLLYMFRTLSVSIIRSTKTVVAATGACHGSGWCISSKDVRSQLHDMHQWLLLQFLVLLMMDTESVRNM